MPIMTTNSQSEKGFTLIEVLVSILILSVGIFSILAVIIVSLQMSSSSVYRTIASQQAYAMAEILRANPTTLITANAASAVAFTAPGSAAISAPCLQSAGCGRNSYIPTALALWQQQLSVVLPGGQGTVCQDSTPNDGTSTGWLCNAAVNAPYVVKVCWDESRVAASSSVSGAGGTTNTGGILCTYSNL